MFDAPTVVHVKRDPYDVYIGRGFRWYAHSVYANPFKIGRDGTREEVLMLFEGLWRRRLASRTRVVWLYRLRSLAGKRLGCWCAPLPCHGDVLVKLFQEFFPTRQGNKGEATEVQ